MSKVITKCIIGCDLLRLECGHFSEPISACCDEVDCSVCAEIKVAEQAIEKECLAKRKAAYDRGYEHGANDEKEMTEIRVKAARVEALEKVKTEVKLMKHVHEVKGKHLNDFGEGTLFGFVRGRRRVESIINKLIKADK